VVYESHPRLLRIFRKFNKQYFQSRLPEPLIYYAHLEESDRDLCFGKVSQDEEGAFLIRIDPQWNSCRAITQWAVLHEMAHVDLWNETITHGAKFQRKMLNLAIAGAFRTIW
jgi:hypothetical protein